MENYQNKENIKVKSKIPLLPLAPLPALPHHLLKKLSGRAPLNTLAGPNGHNHNVTSSFNSNVQLAGASNTRAQSLNNRPNRQSVSCGDEKRSLKRPHSNALQERVKRRLTFSQSVQERIESPDVLTKSYTACLDRQYGGGILSYLLHAETKLVTKPRVRSETRTCVINWLMKINGVDGNPATIQTAVWYLDSVLASGDVKLENMQLMAAAAYWIATKNHGPLTPASKLVKYSDHAFTAQLLLEAEKVILVRLKFPRQPVVPQDYLGYFAWWCKKERPGVIEVTTTFLCLCGMMVNKSLCLEYPSVIAAASIRNAILLLKKKELISRLQMCPAYVAAEEKAVNLSHTCAILRHAVRVVAAKNYSYKFLFEQYGRPPTCIAQAVADAANELALMDTVLH